jgi:hypothetical protein
VEKRKEQQGERYAFHISAVKWHKTEKILFPLVVDSVPFNILIDNPSPLETIGIFTDWTSIIDERGISFRECVK